MIRTLTLALCLAAPAHAQDACAPVADVLPVLAATYNEAPRVRALTAGGALMIVTASDAGGWTAMIVTPDGTACIIAAGEAFEASQPAAPGDPA